MNKFVVLMCLCVGSLSHASISKMSDTPLSRVKNEILGDCRCINYDCGCCAHLEEREIELNSTICVNVTYLVHDYGISFTVTVNSYTIYNETVSVRNPPPVCLGVPYVKEFADACIRLYDIDATTTYLHACVRLEARMKTILIAKYELGCFNIGAPGLSREDKRMTQPKTSVAKHAAFSTSTGSDDSQVKLEEHHTSEESNAADMAVVAVAVTTGLIVLVALIIFATIALARKRGNNAYFTDLLRRQQNYGSLSSASHDGMVKC